MTIICGVDFSEPSRTAMRTAAALATLSHETVVLVHATESASGQGGSAAELLSLERDRLNRNAGVLRDCGIAAEALVATGVPDEVLLEVARQRSARCIVVGPSGHRKRRTPELGSHADRLAHRTHIPVLVVRDAAPFEAWARGERPLKILLAVDLSAETPPAATWVATLSRLGPCEVTAQHLYWPPTEWGRVGLTGVRAILTPAPEVTQALEREFEFCRTALPDAAHLDLRMEPTLGSVASRLAELADERGMDLIVLGSRARGRLRRWWEGSVSRAVLEYATTSVTCVPGDEDAAAITRGAGDSVLVATDFSPVGNAAVPVAYQLLGASGTLHVVHVTDLIRVDPYTPHDIFDSGPDGEATSKRLAALVPEQLASRIKTELHVLRAPNESHAICQAAERLGAGTICMGTRGRTGVTQAVLGSVAAGVLADSHRRVVLVRLPES